MNTNAAATATPSDLLAQLLADASAPVATRAPGHAAVAESIAYAPAAETTHEQDLEAARARVAASDEAARAAGLDVESVQVDKVASTPGTYHAPYAAKAVEKKRAEFNKLPLVEDAAAGIVARVVAEQRQDLEFPLAQVAMRADGQIRLGNVGSDDGVQLVSEEPWSKGQIMGRIATLADVRSPGGLGDFESPTLLRARASLFNGMNLAAQEIHAERVAKAKATHAEAVARYEAEVAARAQAVLDGERVTGEKPKAPAPFVAPTAPSLVLRTRVGQVKDRRSSYAVVSDSYAAVDADKIAEAVADVARGRGLRGEATYNPRTLSTSFDMLAQSNVKAGGMAAGDMSRVGARITSRDDGGGGIRIVSLFYREGCSNMAIMSEHVVKVLSLRHVGDPEELRKRLAAAIDAALQRVDHWLELWGYGCAAKICKPEAIRARDKSSETNLRSLLDGLERQAQADALRDELLGGVYRGLLADIGLDVKLQRDREEIVSGLVRAHGDERNVGAALEGGPSLASLSNGLSLWAHAGQDDPNRRELAEVGAGRLLAWENYLPFEAAPPPAIAAA
jgi:hypothetical protein